MAVNKKLQVPTSMILGSRAVKLNEQMDISMFDIIFCLQVSVREIERG